MTLADMMIEASYEDTGEAIATVLFCCGLAPLIFIFIIWLLLTPHYEEV